MIWLCPYGVVVGYRKETVIRSFQRCLPGVMDTETILSMAQDSSVISASLISAFVVCVVVFGAQNHAGCASSGKPVGKISIPNSLLIWYHYHRQMFPNVPVETYIEALNRMTDSKHKIKL